jgi:tRNA(Ile2) C34 agmatinyltransferase TiaS
LEATLAYERNDTLCPRCREAQQIGIVGKRFYRLCKDCEADEDAALREDADDARREFHREISHAHRD